MNEAKGLIKRLGISFGMIVFLALDWLHVFQIAHANVEWILGKQWDLDVAPLDLDIASSLDGQWVYLLTPGTRMETTEECNT